MLRCLLMLAAAPLLFAQADEVRKLLKDSEVAWNRADLVTFASFYDDSPETTFIGREVTHGGPKEIVARYRRGYPTPEKMGTLTFSEIEVRPLGDGFALAHGKYSLKRTEAGGGDANGRFTLVLRRAPAGWRIIHDHSS
ncbi:MAG: hypothetical protein JWP63_2854 [Candidatus Solibacter sp.]|jgi:uncharacterized protein (TIGR02246 family)|nr:hypothetical protein [Candidatus Solibacter sp.]